MENTNKKETNEEEFRLVVRKEYYVEFSDGEVKTFSSYSDTGKRETEILAKSIAKKTNRTVVHIMEVPAIGTMELAPSDIIEKFEDVLTIPEMKKLVSEIPYCEFKVDIADAVLTSETVAELKERLVNLKKADKPKRNEYIDKIIIAIDNFYANKEINKETKSKSKKKKANKSKAK